MKNIQNINLEHILVFEKKGFKPIFFNVGVKPNDTLSFGGTVSAEIKNETYICLSSLPQELQERVKTAVQALISSR